MPHGLLSKEAGISNLCEDFYELSSLAEVQENYDMIN